MHVVRCVTKLDCSVLQEQLHFCVDNVHKHRYCKQGSAVSVCVSMELCTAKGTVPLLAPDTHNHEQMQMLYCMAQHSRAMDY